MAADIESASDEVEISRSCYGCCGCWSLVVILLLVIVLPLSFSSLEYYQYGLKQRRSSGKVYLDKVYYGGRHFLGPDVTFQAYPADAQVVELQNIDAVSSDKLSTILDVAIIYFINGPELVQLKRELDKTYDAVIQSTALAAIKNTAVRFQTSQYFLNRTLLEDAFTDAVRAALVPLHVSMPLLFLAAISIPDQVAQVQLNSQVQVQANLEAQYAAQSSVIRAETQTKVNAVNNNAAFVAQSAEANATRIVNNAQATAAQVVTGARNAGLKYMYDTLNITTPQEKAAFDYVRALTQNSLTSLQVGFQTKILTQAA